MTSRQFGRSNSLNIYHTVSAAREPVVDLRRRGKTTALVPTMGALHEGHRRLIQQASLHHDAVFVSIFVNPTQFAAGEDLQTYPRPIEHDLEVCRQLGVAGVFCPDEATMYPAGTTTSIGPPSVAEPLEGVHRPGHFGGVCTVVAKLLGILPTDAAYFGKKDYQQWAVIAAMVRDLNIPTQIIGCEIIRDTDSLALSSRNVYLSEHERRTALAIPATLNRVVTKWRGGNRDIDQLQSFMAAELSATDLQYATIRDARTFGDPIPGNLAVALIATRVGTTRLIDNVELHP